MWRRSGRLVWKEERESCATVFTMDIASNLAPRDVDGEVLKTTGIPKERPRCLPDVESPLLLFRKRRKRGI